MNKFAILKDGVCCWQHFSLLLLHSLPIYLVSTRCHLYILIFYHNKPNAFEHHPLKMQSASNAKQRSAKPCFDASSFTRWVHRDTRDTKTLGKAVDHLRQGIDTYERVLAAGLPPLYQPNRSLNPVRPPPPPPRSSSIQSRSSDLCHAPNHPHDGCVAVIAFEADSQRWPSYIGEAIENKELRIWRRASLEGGLEAHIKGHRQDIIEFFKSVGNNVMWTRPSPVSLGVERDAVNQNQLEEEGWTVLDDQDRDEGWVKMAYKKRDDDEWVDLGLKHSEVSTQAGVKARNA